jgi:hypothetical protein
VLGTEARNEQSASSSERLQRANYRRVSWTSVYLWSLRLAFATISDRRSKTSRNTNWYGHTRGYGSTGSIEDLRLITGSDVSWRRKDGNGEVTRTPLSTRRYHAAWRGLTICNRGALPSSKGAFPHSLRN